MRSIRLGEFPGLRLDFRSVRFEFQIAWDLILQRDIDHIFHSIPRVVEECINFRGDLIHYYNIDHLIFVYIN